MNKNQNAGCTFYSLVSINFHRVVNRNRDITDLVFSPSLKPSLFTNLSNMEFLFRVSIQIIVTAMLRRVQIYPSYEFVLFKFVKEF